MSIIEADPLEEIPVLDNEPKVEIDPVIQALIDAKDIIKQFGWYNPWLEHKGPHCVLTAITAASESNVDHRLAAINRISQVTDASYIPIWNDAPGRTLEEVYEAFDKAIMNG